MNMRNLLSLCSAVMLTASVAAQPTAARHAGELVMAHRGTSIAGDGVPIVAPLAHSGSAKSQCMAMQGPYGMRAAVYEH